MGANIEAILDTPCERLFFELKRADRNLFNFLCCALGYDDKSLACATRSMINEECSVLVENWDTAVANGMRLDSASNDLQRILARRWELEELIRAIRMVEVFAYPWDFAEDDCASYGQAV